MELFKKNKDVAIATIMAAASLLYTILIAVVDRKAIAPDGSKVGWAALNQSFSKAIGYNTAMDKVSDVFMVVAILTAVSFAILGVLQLIKRKNVLKVDKAILVMVALYIVMAIIYILFDKAIVINRRPYLLENEEVLEASFPSSHVFVITTIMGSAIIAWKKIFRRNEQINKILEISAYAVIALGLAFRIASGVHWLTDIIGGILFGATLVLAYRAVLPIIEKKFS